MAKIGIVGLGYVGAASAYSIVIQKFVQNFTYMI